MKTTLFEEKVKDQMFNDRKIADRKYSIRIEQKIVTPEMAKNWLTVNDMNRRVDFKTVDYYAKQMKDGEWTLTNDAIVFSNTHRLLNGQHRLMAVIKSETSQLFFVAFNMDEDTFINMDQSKKRTPSDVFQIKGIKDYCDISAGINKYISLKKGFTSKSRGEGYAAASRRDTKLSIKNMLDLYYENEELIQDIQNVAQTLYRKFKYFKKSDYMSYSIYLVLDKNYDIDIVTDFFKQLSHGGPEIKNKTISVLRDKLVENHMSNKKMTGQLRDALLIKTWNAFIKNKELIRLYFNPDNENKPEFI